MNLNIGLEAKQREAVVGLLSPLLPDEYVLYTKTRNYHWNVVGPQFNDLHKFFQEQYGAGRRGGRGRRAGDDARRTCDRHVGVVRAAHAPQGAPGAVP